MAQPQWPQGFPPASPEAQSPQSSAFSYEGVYRDFVWEKLDQDPHAFDKIFENTPSLQYDDVWDDFELYLRVRDQGLVDKFKKDDSRIGIMRELFISAFPIHFLREELRNIFEVEQKSQSSFDQSKLKDYLDSLKPSDLKALRANYEQRILESKRQQIINDTDEQALLLEVNDHTKLLEKIFSPSVPQNIIDGAREVLEKYLDWSIVNSADIKTLFALFDLDQKKAFLEYWLPAITVDSLLKNSIINKQEAKILVQKKIWTYFSQKEFDALFLKLDLACFFIQVAELSDAQIENLAKNDEMCRLIASAYDKPREDKELKEKNEKLEVPITTLADFQDKLQINPKLANLPHAKIIPWSTILLTKWETKNYFLIDSLDDSGVVLNNITFEDRVVHTESGTKETQTLQKFYEMFLATQDNWQVSIEIFNASEFEALGLQTVPELDKVHSKQALLDLMNEVDKDGKDVNIDKMAFQCKRQTTGNDSYLNDKIETFSVSSVDDQFVKLEWQSPMTLTDFANAFSSRECKRFERVDWLWDMFRILSTKKGHYEEVLKDYEIKDDKFINKTTKEVVSDFVDDKWNVVRFDAFDWNGVNLQIGENYKNSFKCETKGEWLSYQEVYMYLISHKFRPSKKELPTVESKKWTELKNHRGFLKRYMSGLSIIEIVSWGKQFIRAIEDHLKTWNRLKSAKFASFLWKALPIEIQNELKNSVQSEEKKVMEEQVSKLKAMNTEEMIAAIEKILEESTPRSPELEAALMTIISKYGLLYPKELAKYKDTFLWYRRLWGRIWDETYLKYKKDCEENIEKDENWVEQRTPIPFTEEYLVEKLLANQVKKMQRRSKFDKDYGWYRNQGMKAELEDGADKTKDYSTAKGRVTHAMNEFKNLTYNNGIWWMENVWAKWPDPDWLMNTIPFVIVSTWISMEFTQPMINQVKGYAFGTPFTTLWFISNLEKIKLHNDFILKIIELKYSTWSTMYKSFQEMLGTSDRKQKIKLAEDFWEKYGAKIYPMMTFKDGFVMSRMKKTWNEVLLDYYNKIKWLHQTSDFTQWIKKDDINNKWIDYSNHPVAATEALVDDTNLFRFGDGWSYTSTANKKAVHMYLDYFKQTICNGPEIEASERERLFRETYQFIERTIMAKWLLGFVGRWGPDTYKNWDCYKDSVEKWITFYPESFLGENGKLDQNRYDKEVLDVEWAKFQRWSARKIADVQNVARQSTEDILKAA